MNKNELIESMLNKQCFSYLSNYVKNNGKLPIELLDDFLIYHLWNIELISDSNIGELFGLSRGAVQSRRKKYGINNLNFAKDIFKNILEEILYSDEF